MAPTIRIDDEVYQWLQKQARPFEDTPNSVLRRVKDQLSREPRGTQQANSFPSSPEPKTTLNGEDRRQEQGTQRNIVSREPIPIIRERPFTADGVEFPHGTEFRMIYPKRGPKRKIYYAKAHDGLLVRTDTQQGFPSFSGAACTITPNLVNGWKTWECKRPGDTEWQLIDFVRHPERRPEEREVIDVLSES